MNAEMRQDARDFAGILIVGNRRTKHRMAAEGVVRIGRDRRLSERAPLGRSQEGFAGKVAFRYDPE